MRVILRLPEAMPARLPHRRGASTAHATVQASPSRRQALRLLAALCVPCLEPSACRAGVAEDAASGIYGRNERSVVPILGDLMGMVGPAGIQLDRASAQLGKLSETQSQLEQLRAELQAPNYRGGDEASSVVLRLSAIYFKTAPAAMDLTSKLMTRLSAEELAEAQAITASFETAVQALEQGCRDRDVPAQLAAATAANSRLGDYFRVASAQYTVPTVGAAAR